MKRLLLIMALACVLVLGMSAVVLAYDNSEAQMIQTHFLDSHHTEIDASMILSMEDWYGIPPVVTLTILGAETSLGDPKLGGRLTSYYNYGCIRYTGTSSKWGGLSNGRVIVAGKDWFSWPDAWTGMTAWGRYIKTGTIGVPNIYRPILLGSSGPNWNAFADIYYGRGVPGLATYKANLKTLAAKWTHVAAEHGYSW